jgi:DNA polymerase I-like protein with 3'-5' exonuclease and polymerase domains
VTLLAVLKYRAQLKTCVETFMVPWLATAERSEGFIYTPWNQVKNTDGSGSVGTRTGRLSSSRFQNIPKEFEPIFKSKDHPELPRCPLKDLPDLPLVRSYITPFPGHVLIDRDYSQQEPRILAHFDGGELMQKYLDNPWIDFHDYARDELAKRGKHYQRKPVKNTNLGLIYGMGVGKLAIKNNMTVEESGLLKSAILQLYPGLKQMYSEMRRRARANEPVRTWGGREYYCEPPKIIDGKIRQFDYKMVNVLIQGSAADCTKEAIIRLQNAIDAVGKGDTWFILLNVHDQLTASVPIADLVEAMDLMRGCMEGIEFDVPMLSEGSVSFTNWAELRDYDKKGRLVDDWKMAIAA